MSLEGGKKAQSPWLLTAVKANRSAFQKIVFTTAEKENSFSYSVMCEPLITDEVMFPKLVMLQWMILKVYKLNFRCILQSL